MVLKGPHTNGAKFVEQLIYPSDEEKNTQRKKTKTVGSVCQKRSGYFP